jgi:hypothetical protein
MNRKIFIPIFILVVLALSACGTKTPTTSTTEQTTSSANTSTGATLSEAEILIIGTLKLKGTDQEVDATQAAQLLSYWQLYKTMYASDTTAQEELDATINTIKSTMTDAQMQAIDAMNLSQQDIMTVMQDLGVGFSGRSSNSSSSTTGSQNSQEGAIIVQGGPGEGGMPPSGGNIPSGGAQTYGGGPGTNSSGGSQGPSFSYQGGNDGQGMNPEMLATLQAGGGNVVTHGSMLQPLLEAIIQYLSGLTSPQATPTP